MKSTQVVPGIMVLHQIQGVEANKKIISPVNPLTNAQSDDNRAPIYESGVQGFGKVNSKLSTMDKIVQGATSDGLPFNITVRGISGNALDMFSFIDKNVTTLMDKYAQALSSSQNAEATIKDLIRDIYLACPKSEIADQNFKFTLSIAISYKKEIPSMDKEGGKENTLRVAGFGIGDTSSILATTDRVMKPLANAYYAINNGKSSFDTFDSDYNPIRDSENEVARITEVERLVSRNGVFDEEIKPGDRLVSHTHLEAREILKTSEPEKLNQNYGNYLIKRSSDEEGFWANSNASMVRTNLDPEKTALFEDTMNDPNKVNAYLTGFFIVPTPESQKRYQKAIFDKEKEQLNKRLAPNEFNTTLPSIVQSVMDAINAMEEEFINENLADLNRDLAACNDALDAHAARITVQPPKPVEPTPPVEPIEPQKKDFYFDFRYEKAKKEWEAEMVPYQEEMRRHTLKMNEHKRKMVEYKDVLKRYTDAINRCEKAVSYLKSRALNAQGKLSWQWNGFGIAMMVLGVTLAAAGSLILVASTGLALTGIFAIPGAAGIGIGAGLAIGGSALFFAGVGSCVHGRQKGLSKGLDTTADVVVKETPVLRSC